jgi:hypothetical protein
MRTARLNEAVRSSMRVRLYLCDALLPWLPQPLQEMAAALRPRTQQAHAMVGQRHLARPRHLAAPDQPYSRQGT